ncbi:MAG: hypothetical protein ACO1SV_25500 [Fimbriimonas sp.]
MKSRQTAFALIVNLSILRQIYIGIPGASTLVWVPQMVPFKARFRVALVYALADWNHLSPTKQEVLQTYIDKKGAVLSDEMDNDFDASTVGSFIPAAHLNEAFRGSPAEFVEKAQRAGLTIPQPAANTTVSHYMHNLLDTFCRNDAVVFDPITSETHTAILVTQMSGGEA